MVPLFKVLMAESAGFLIQRKLGSKPLGGLKVDSACHSNKINQINTKISWGLSSQKQSVCS